MSKRELINNLNILTSQFTFFREALNSELFGTKCDFCKRSVADEGWLIMGTKKICDFCQDRTYEPCKR